MQQQPIAQFGRIRAFLWPAYRHETKKLVPMLLMLFCICFNYSVLHNLKDSLVVTGTSAGAEVIPFIKVWVMLPMAVLLTFVFTKLTNKFSQEHVFYIMISGFLCFYAFFTFVLYPARDWLHPNATADAMLQVLPTGFKGLIAMFRNWTFTAFYVMCELWASIVMSVLFWGFANEITKIAEAARFYGILGVGSNLAAVIAGQTANYFSQSNYNPNLPFGQDAWEQTLIGLVSLIILSGIFTMGVFYWMNRNVLNDPSFDELHKTNREIKTKHKKLSIRESFNYLSSSKYLVCIAIVVVSYNLVINLVEVVWKDQLRHIYSSGTDYNTYLNNITSTIGIISTITALFMARIIGKYGWSFTALITPVIMLITSVGFFAFLFFRDYTSAAFIAFTGTTPLAIAVFFGSMQNCLSKAAKYSVFDATKEMAFIPLSHELKLKGKAAIDGVGSRLGKSGGSLIHQGLLMMFVTFTSSAPIVASILMLVIVLWIVAVRALGRQFNALKSVKQQEAILAAELAAMDGTKPEQQLSPSLG